MHPASPSSYDTKIYKKVWPPRRWKNERNTATSSLEVGKVTFIGAGRKLFFSVKKKLIFFFVTDLRDKYAEFL
jgi:hypothetical protein